MKTRTIISIYLSYFLLILSNGRIQTRMAKRILKKRRDRRAAKIEQMQKELDEQHEIMRGWTSKNYEDSCNSDKAKEARLKSEIKRTQMKYSVRKGGQSW